MLPLGAFGVGHRNCNYYAATLVTNGKATDLLDHSAFGARFVRESTSLEHRRTHPLATAALILKWSLNSPGILGYGLISMCLHNAKPDAFILKPLKMAELSRHGEGYFVGM